MAIQLDQIRTLADRIAVSHLLEVVDLDFSGGVKFRTLRIFIEKNAETRARLAGEATAADGENPLPKDVPTELLSFTTHEDCAAFAQDFGTVVDVEDLIPGADYTLEVSSPGLDRKLVTTADFIRFAGSLIKVQTFTAIEGNRHFQGRLTTFEDNILTLDLAAIKRKSKPKKGFGKAENNMATIPFANVEKANLIAEI